MLYVITCISTIK